MLEQANGIEILHDETLSARKCGAKRKGELSELAFMHKAVSLGFGVAKPYGDSERYDFIVDSGERLWRVQVKSTSAMQYGAYRLNTQRNTNGRALPYMVGEIDFVLGQVVPEDTWFVLPVEAFSPRKSVALYARDDRRVGEYSRYREAWHLLTPKGDVLPQACLGARCPKLRALETLRNP